MTDEVDQDNNDLHGGRWANMWLTIFFVLQATVMLASLCLNFCLIRAMARNANKETSVIYMALMFFFFTSLVDTGLIFGKMRYFFFIIINDVRNIYRNKSADN